MFLHVPCNSHLMEKSLKSPRRSHTRRPVRDALLEYAGPMPFLVVPMLKINDKCSSCSILYLLVLNPLSVLSYVFPSWACLSVSCRPSTTWWKSNTVDGQQTDQPRTAWAPCKIYNLMHPVVSETRPKIHTKVSSVWDYKSLLPAFQT